MDKYNSKAEEILANKKNHGHHKIHPEIIAQKNLSEGEFSGKILEEFFTGAYGEILVEYFKQWLQTQPHEVKTREFLYNCAMGLGDVKNKLIQKETLGNNISTLQDMEKNNNG